MRILFTSISLLACSSEEVISTLDFNWSGGEFDFQTTAADDSCLEGALEILFMPNGPDTPHAFEYPIYLPAYDEVPMTYAIDLREPFMGMEVTVREGPEGVLVIRDSIMESVALGAGTYGDCVVTMSVDADILPTSPTSAEGSAVIGLSNPRGSDERCPVLDSDPCSVDLSVLATAD